MMSRILRKGGIENSGNEEPLQSIPLPLLFTESEEKKSRTNKSYVYDKPCLGCLDLYSSGMTIPSHLHSEMRLQNSLTKRNFRAGS